VSEIVGRDEALRSVLAFFDQGAEGPVALVLEGEAGIGKSTLWLQAIEYGRRDGRRVLSCRPAAAERGLAQVGLIDLLEGSVDEVLPALSAPKRRALEVALLRDEAGGDGVDRRTLAVATHTVLQLLGEQSPLLVAVDDAQWLDSSSSALLAFALRRQDRSRVRALLTRRLESGVYASDLEDGLGSAHVERLPVGPLSVGALHRLLVNRLGRPFARQTLLRIHEGSGGNPFFALEIARVVAEDRDPGRPLPVPETLEELVHGRISCLPDATRETLGLVAALGTATELLLERAGVEPSTLEPAFVANVLEREGHTVRFTHPLLASASYTVLGVRRAAVHRRIVEFVDDPLARAHHLALATTSPDADVAAALDEACSLAGARGAQADAATFAEQALRLTPATDVDVRRRRALTAARAYRAAGEWTRARAIATDLLAESPAGPWRAEALYVLSQIEIDDLAVRLLEDALQEADGNPALQSRVQTRLALTSRFRKGFAGALEDARIALVLAEQTGDEALTMEALAVLIMLGSAVGDEAIPEWAARAWEIATASGDPYLLREARAFEVSILSEGGRIEEARTLLEQEYEAWRDRDELFGAELLWELAWIELDGGRWEMAADYAARSRDISLQYRQEGNQNYIPSSWIALHRGQFEVARVEAERGLELCEEQIGFLPPLLLAAPGLVALWSGDAATAEDFLGRADRCAEMLGWREPARRPWTADYSEALLELGRIDEAERLLDRWEADALRLDRAWVLAQVTRCRGLVAAAGGNVGKAETLLIDAVVAHEQVGDRFGRARASLALGLVRRRARQKKPAREAIDEALRGFEELGAVSWADKARAELGRIGGRSREEGLTAAERRVAALVAEGRTNREVAAALFLGERTVASHLTHIYAKLGVRSRAELARKVQTF
jgi:DNA-binding CsgD family transcriptional regulator